MSHNEARTSWLKEGLAALFCGGIFGFTNVIVGHPLDTIKTRMQVSTVYRNNTLLNSILLIYKNEGVRGYYKGATPTLFGSIAFRSVQFGVFEALYTKWSNSKLLTKKIPGTKGLEPRVILASIASGSIRSFVECPFEYLKVQGQTNQKSQLNHFFKGFFSVWLRSVGLVTVIFLQVDFLRRNTDTYSKRHLLFLVTGTVGVISYLSIWPLEVCKNIIQSSKSNIKFKDVFLNQIKEYGLRQGLFRGILPGLLSVFLRSGAGNTAMVSSQQWLTKIGYRK